MQQKSQPMQPLLLMSVVGSQQHLLPQLCNRQTGSPAAVKHGADCWCTHALLMLHSAAQLQLQAASAARNTQQHSTTAMQCSRGCGKQQALGLLTVLLLQG
jgi:hypothetical protein